MLSVSPSSTVRAAVLAMALHLLAGCAPPGSENVTAPKVTDIGKLAPPGLKSCRLQAAGETDDDPYFAFPDDTRPGADFSCEESGPVIWVNRYSGKSSTWYIQRITDLVPDRCLGPNAIQSCTTNSVRICSKQARDPGVDAKSFAWGPCGTVQGVGAKGCERCYSHDRPI